MPEGIVTKAVGGFFTVATSDGEYVCKARGVFRKQGVSVLVGDRVAFTPLPSREGVIQEVLPRKTELKRPPIANVDQAILVSSCTHPDFQSALLDRMIVSSLAADLNPVLVVNKVDLLAMEDVLSLARPYETAGHQVVLVSTTAGIGLDEFRRILENRISVFVGPSGVGKSSLANMISPELGLKMGDISEKMGRGKHTTRHVELFRLNEATLVADAPGFSQLEVSCKPEELRHFFWEFAAPSEECAYRGCVHIDEDDCGVKRSVRLGQLPVVRYESYVSLYNECKEKEDHRY